MNIFVLQVRDKIHHIVARIKSMHPRTIIRAAFVGYRDYSDDARVISSAFFSGPSVAASLKTFAASVLADGGDDAAEDVFSGLEAVADLDWSSAGTRLLVHIADAPMHGMEFHDKHVDDDFPSGDYLRRSIREILSKLQNNCKIQVRGKLS